MTNSTYIYGLSNPRSRLIRYVGKSNNPEKRLRLHLVDRHRNHRTNWIASLKAIGEIPEIVILDRVPTEEWQHWEQYYISHLGRVFDLVNETAGRDGGVNLSINARRKISLAHKGKKKPPRSEEHSRRISEALKGKTHTAETKRKMSLSRTGKRFPGRVHTDEYKHKMSESTKGRKFTDEHRQHLSESARGNTNGLGREYICTEETRQKLSEARRQRPPPGEETRQRLSKAGLGRKHTEETRCKMRASRANRPPVSDETRRRMSESGKRRPPMSNETRRKLSEAMRGNRNWMPRQKEARENQ